MCSHEAAVVCFKRKCQVDAKLSRRVKANKQKPASFQKTDKRNAKWEPAPNYRSTVFRKRCSLVRRHESREMMLPVEKNPTGNIFQIFPLIYHRAVVGVNPSLLSSPGDCEGCYVVNDSSSCRMAPRISCIIQTSALPLCVYPGPRDKRSTVTCNAWSHAPFEMTGEGNKISWKNKAKCVLAELRLVDAHMLAIMPLGLISGHS